MTLPADQTEQGELQPTQPNPTQLPSLPFSAPLQTYQYLENFPKGGKKAASCPSVTHSSVTLLIKREGNRIITGISKEESRGWGGEGEEAARYMGWAAAPGWLLASPAELPLKVSGKANERKELTRQKE